MGGSGQLQQQTRRPRDDLSSGDPYPRTGAGASTHLDEAFGFQDADGLTQGGPAYAEVGHQLGLVGQEVAVFEGALDDHAS